MPTLVKYENIDGWVKARLPYVVQVRLPYPHQTAGEWGQNVFGKPITGTLIDTGTLLYEMRDDDFDWTWVKESFYFKKARDAVVFKLRWGA